MKKIAAVFLAAVMITALCGCTKQGSSGNKDEGTSKYAQAVDVLDAVAKAYAEEEAFAMYGGDQENAVMDAPGKFDLSKTQEMDNTLGLPQDQADQIDDAASMVHMMNANTFTGAAYHLKDSADLNGFSEAVKSNILGKQWVCGSPETLVIIQAGGNYVVTAYGNGEMIDTFKNHALSVIDGSQVIVETPIG